MCVSESEAWSECCDGKRGLDVVPESEAWSVPESEAWSEC